MYFFAEVEALQADFDVMNFWIANKSISNFNKVRCCACLICHIPICLAMQLQTACCALPCHSSEIFKSQPKYRSVCTCLVDTDMGRWLLQDAVFSIHKDDGGRVTKDGSIKVEECESTEQYKEALRSYFGIVPP